MTTHTPVIVVGGGVAGLAAAVRLTARGVPVLLLEQRPHAGGRTWSFRDEPSGEVIDNGQHLLIGGYRCTFALLDTLGVRDGVHVQHRPSLLFHHPARGFRRFRIPPLPAPLNLLSGALLSDLLHPGDRLRMLKAGAALRRGPGAKPGPTAAAWFEAQGQSVEARRSFWDPLTLAVMNERPERAAAGPLVSALGRAFLDSPGGAALAVPRVGLSDLFVRPALAFLAKGGAQVRCRADVRDLLSMGGRVRGVRLGSGEEIHGSAVILAVPWHAAGAIIRGALPESNALWKADASPIVSIHLWFAEDFMPDDSVGLIGRRLHWLFNRRRFIRDGRTDGHLSAVISAARDIVAWENAEILTLALEEIRGVYPCCPASPVRGVVIREKRATPSLTPYADHTRPGPETALRGLFLAGDWTATGLPATIEGAVESGERCAGLAWAQIASFEVNGDIK